MGVYEALRETNPDIKVYSAQPATSQELTGGEAGKHKIEGIADGFIPSILDTDIIYKTINVKDEQAVNMARQLAQEKGLFVGISSGCNVFAALRIARRLKKGQNVVTVLPDRADRYLSIGLFDKVDADKVVVPTGCETPIK